jgi:hypothetical protein
MGAEMSVGEVIGTLVIPILAVALQLRSVLRSGRDVDATGLRGRG